MSFGGFLRAPRQAKADRTARSPRVMTIGQVSTRLRRWVLWASLGLVLVLMLFFAFRGMGASGHAAVVAGAPVASFPDDDAKAFAATFARTFLTYSPRTVAEQQAALQPMMRDGLSAADAVSPQHGGAPQRVVAAWPARPKDLGQGHGRVTVACLVVSEGVSRMVYLAVPVARDARGRLAVDDLPAPVAVPQRGTPTVSPEVDLGDAAAAPIKDLLARFMPVYLSGKPVEPQFLAPGGEVAALGHAYTLQEVVSVTQVGPPTSEGRVVLARVRMTDSTTKAQFMASYRILVAKPFDRWLIKKIQT